MYHICFIFTPFPGYIVSNGTTGDEFALLFIFLTSIALALALLFSFINLSRTQGDLLKRLIMNYFIFQATSSPTA